MEKYDALESTIETILESNESEDVKRKTIKDLIDQEIEVASNVEKIYLATLAIYSKERVLNINYDPNHA